MTLRRLMSQVLTVQPVGAASTDAYGNAVLGSTGAAVQELGYLEQRDTVEYIDGRQTTITKWVAYLTTATVVTPMAYISLGGQRFQVDGEPWHVYNPRTSAISHVECKLTVVS